MHAARMTGFLRSVAGDGRVDFGGPGINAAAQGLGVFKALVAQPDGDIHGAHAVMAHDDEMFFRVEFLVNAGGDFSHGDEEAALDVGGGELPGFADIEEAGFALLQEGGGF